MPLAKTRGKDVQSKNAFMVTIFATSIFFSQVSYSRCYNLDLKNAGFVIHPQINFDELDATLDKKMIDEKDDAQGHGNYAYMGMGSLQPWGNPDIYQYLVIDDVRTPKNEMIGDVVYFRDQPYPHGQRVEIRWYENGVKNVVFKQSCAQIGPSGNKNSLLVDY